MRDGFIKVAAATPEIKVAHCDYNAKACIELIGQAADQGVKVLVFPELVLTGATCGDLFYQGTLLQGAENALNQVLEATAELDMVVVLGLPVRGEWDNKLYNCAAVLSSGSILALVPKTHLTQAESRWFVSGAGMDTGAVLCGERCNLSTNGLFACSSVPDLVIGVEVGGDLFAPAAPSAALAQAGATLILNPCAQPSIVGSDDYRRGQIAAQSSRLLCGYVSANAGEGESTTDLVFTGHNVIAERGAILAETDFACGLTVSEIDVEALSYERRRSAAFTAKPLGETYWRASFDLDVEDTALTRFVGKNPFVPETDREKRCAQMLNIAALGLKKRLAHTYAKTAVVGLSGGLDSTLALLITARAMKMLCRPMTDILCVTMPCFGTTKRTKSNAEVLAERIGTSFKTVHIAEAVSVHFRDIGQSMDDLSVTFENAQARERTQVLMDLSNDTGGIVVGTGDFSELALGWATYNGDHMSMYGVNAGIPKTQVRQITDWYARTCGNRKLAEVLWDILDTPVSPELLPPKEDQIAQKTEDLVGPYPLHDFFLYYLLRYGFGPQKILRLARIAFAGEYGDDVIKHWLRTCFRRFFTQQYKRSCLPDGPMVGPLSLSPRGAWKMPSDAFRTPWQEELDNL